MYAFICCDVQPVSVNARRNLAYQRRIQTAFQSYWPSIPLVDGELYAAVYYFHNVPTQLDADNLSKPVIDALTNVLYSDDRLIKLRHSGIFDLRSGDANEIDLTKMPNNVINDFINKLGESDHILYVEVGELDNSMYMFSYEN